MLASRAAMRALKGGFTRAFPDHRTHDGRRYRAYCRAVVARLGKLPPDALATLQAAGLCAVELERLALDLGGALASRKRRRDATRIRRQLVILRSQLPALERRLEELSRTACGRGGLGAFLDGQEGQS